MAKKSGITFEQLIKQLEEKSFHPVYILDGEETYFTDTIVNYFEKNTIPTEEQDFNLSVFYGREVSGLQIIEQVRQYPMFGDKQLVIVKDASHVKDIGIISDYLNQPMPTSILVLDFKGKNLDKRTQLAKTIIKSGVHYKADKLKDYEIPKWIEKYGKQQGLEFTPDAINLIQLYIGNDLNKIINELNKFEINKTTQSKVDANIVSEFIGINKEYQVLDFPDMIFHQNVNEVARMLNYFVANPKQAAGPFISGVFYNFISKVLLSYYNRGGNFAEDRKLGIWAKHRQVAQRIPQIKMLQALLILEQYSQKTVGINSTASDSSELKWFTGQLMHLMRTP